jgi:hypothetical protein
MAKIRVMHKGNRNFMVSVLENKSNKKLRAKRRKIKKEEIPDLLFQIHTD